MKNSIINFGNFLELLWTYTELNRNLQIIIDDLKIENTTSHRYQTCKGICPYIAKKDAMRKLYI